MIKGGTKLIDKKKLKPRKAFDLNQTEAGASARASIYSTADSIATRAHSIAASFAALIPTASSIAVDSREGDASGS